MKIPPALRDLDIRGIQFSIYIRCSIHDSCGCWRSTMSAFGRVFHTFSSYKSFCKKVVLLHFSELCLAQLIAHSSFSMAIIFALGKSSSSTGASSASPHARLCRTPIFSGGMQHCSIIYSRYLRVFSAGLSERSTLSFSQSHRRVS